MNTSNLTEASPTAGPRNANDDQVYFAISISVLSFIFCIGLVICCFYLFGVDDSPDEVGNCDGDNDVEVKTTELTGGPQNSLV